MPQLHSHINFIASCRCADRMRRRCCARCIAGMPNGFNGPPDLDWQRCAKPIDRPFSPTRIESNRIESIRVASQCVALRGGAAALLCSHPSRMFSESAYCYTNVIAALYFIEVPPRPPATTHTHPARTRARVCSSIARSSILLAGLFVCLFVCFRGW